MKKKIIFLIIFFGFFINTNVVLSEELYKVTLNKCVDGDTAWLNLNNDIIKARFLAINTKESTNKIEKYGKEASIFTCNYLRTAKLIEIEYDKNSDKYDKYKRHLVWIFVDKKLLQDLLVKEGLAEIKYIYGEYKYLDIIKKSELLAKKNKLNIYSDEKQFITIFSFKVDRDLLIAVITLIFITFLYITNPKIRKKLEKFITKKIIKKIDDL